MLRVGGPLSALGSIRVQTEMKVASSKRVMVRFSQPGELPAVEVDETSSAEHPSLALYHRSGEQLQICRGNAETTFALLKRNDLALSTFLEYEDSQTRLEFASNLSQNGSDYIPFDGTHSSASTGVQQQRRSCSVDSRDLCLDHCASNVGTP